MLNEKIEINEIRILLVEDNLGDARLMQLYLEEENRAHFVITHVTRLSDLTETGANNYQVTLLDLSLPDSQGLDTFYSVQQLMPDTPIVILTGLNNTELALQAIREGAQDYLNKFDITQSLIIKAIYYAIQRKKLQDQELKIRIQDEQIRLLSEFVQNASHDLRTPLTTIISSAYLLRRRIEAIESFVDEKIPDHIHKLEAQALRMNDLLNDYLNMSLLDTKEVIGEFSQVDLHSLLELIYHEISASAQQKNQTIHLEITESITLWADAIQLQRALTNIAINAVTYTPENGEITLKLKLMNSMGHVMIGVVDSGIGISADELPSIFNRFYRADNARSTATGGTGLGLSIVKRIIELHNGYVDVQSEVGVGTRFMVFIPLNQNES